MKFPFFASFIVFCIWLGYEIKKHRRLEEKSMDEFWEKEAAANNTRRKPLDDLDYIQIPLDELPMDILADDPQVKEYHETLTSLSGNPIVNFSGISNTDLKLQYGAPNIAALTLYDQRYTILARTLQNLAAVLYEKGYVTEACTVLEFAISTRTDVSASYRLLITIYKELGQTEKIPDLLPVAQSLTSGLKNSIIRMIEEA